MSLYSILALASATLDLDGDGVDDLVSLAPHGERPTEAGRVEIVSGRTGAVVWSAAFSPGFGSSFAPLGDLDGDGLSEFAIGSPRESHAGRAGAGAVYVFSLRSSRVMAWAIGAEPGAALGTSLVSVDRDGDGRPDAVNCASAGGSLLLSPAAEGGELVVDRGEGIAAGE